MTGWLLLMGPPGCDYAPTRDLKAPETREAARSIAGAASVAFVDLVAAVELGFRRPVAKRFKPVERTFRISQQWFLYRDGPSRPKWLEIYVDGEMVFRTGHPEATWRREQFRNRRFRPMVETAAMKKEAVNWAGIGRFIVDRAREDFPDAQEVRIVARRGRFGQPEEVVRHARTARAPDWALTKDELPEEPKR